ncbi:uncharacterized protein N7484_009429 [Penicillium longicatenatum]|uniref:uncharacterized protein n=1 Tax=Penicillium longicatenatum TaxID=1561947 RepID=UPI00254915DB|nr:uncharacterized protein N7484_009429 [Penicillium longicatenatum]KAJ5636116.1 hypothetical protein N7484_009429 [Penicillium longicatenatum]
MEDPPSTEALTLEETSYLFHHLFLPPKLPQAEDYNAGHEHLLLNIVIDALRSFRKYVPNTTVLHQVTETIARLRITHGPQGDVDETQLTKSLTELPVHGKHLNTQIVEVISKQAVGGFLPIHVRQQNAGILLSWQDDAIHIESFELSARNESVMVTVGRLRRVFPGSTMLMDKATFDEPGFQELMAQTIARMSHQRVAGTKPKVKKAKQEHDEDRDTTHPKMVTEFLMSTLRPRCTDVTAAQIQKNTREEVMWLDCQSPWRRSALWLLVRVVLQLVFHRLARKESSGDLYKQFMVFFMTSIVDRASSAMQSESLFLMNAKILRRLLKLGLTNEPGASSPRSSDAD